MSRFCGSRYQAADDLESFLANPHAPMPPLQLSRTEIEDIVAYLATLRAR